MGRRGLPSGHCPLLTRAALGRWQGTKRSCAEGGCGACVVSLARTNSQGETVMEACNSCLRLLCSMEGESVVTIEGLGG